MGTTAPDYSAVDYYQLNASLERKGDSAIAVLVLRKPSSMNPKEQKGIIKSCVLVDGGNGPLVAKLIIRCLGYIQSQYSGDARLDAISISHWDDDHTKGFYQFLEMDSLWNVNNCFSWFRYDVKDDETDANKKIYTSKTRLYVQDWARADNGARGPIMAPGPSQDRTSPFWGSITVGNRTIANAILVSALPSKVLGFNLFNGIGLDTGTTSSQIKTPNDLVAKNNPNQGGMGDGAPGLYVFGVMNIGMGDRNVIGVVNRGEKLNDTNARSIVLLLIWPNGDSKPIVSLYSGGDTEYTMENKVANFLTDKSDEDETKWTTIPIKVIKAGHHGSLISTSIDFIDAVKPDHYLVSAGLDHGHPVPEIIMFMAVWFAQNSLADISLKRMHGVCWPYHVGLVHDDDTVRYFRSCLAHPDFLTSNFVVPTRGKRAAQDLKDFITKIEARYIALGKGSDNCVTKITAGVDEVNTNHQTSSAGVKTAQKSAQDLYDAAAKKKPLNREAKDKAKDVLDKAIAATTAVELEMLNEKIEVVSKNIQPLWSDWSDITRQYFPICEFKGEEVPSLLLSIEWIEIRFTKTTCEFAMPKTATNTIALDTGTKSAKEAKTEIEQNDGLFEAQAIDATPRNVQGKSKGKRKFNGGFAADGMSLTLDNEVSLRNREEENQIVPDLELELALMDDGSDFSVVPNVSTSFGLSGEFQALAEDTVTLTSFSSIYASGMGKTPDALVLVESTNEEDFVFNLQGSHLDLSNATKAVDQWQCTLSASDALQLWLESFFSGPIHGDTGAVQSLTLALTGNVETPSITSWQLAWSMSFTEGNVKLTYNTNATMQAFNLDPAAVSNSIDDQGYLTSSVGLLLGLVSDDQVAMFMISMAEAFQLLDFPFPTGLLAADAQLSILTDTSAVNGFWLFPAANNSVIWRMSFAPYKQTSASWLAVNIGGLTVTGTSLMIRKQAHQRDTVKPGLTATTAYIVSQNDLCLRASVKMSATGTPWDAFISVSATSLGFVMRWNSTLDPLSELWTWLQQAFGLDVKSSLDTFGAVAAGTLSLREISFIVSNNSGTWQLQTIALQFQWDLSWGVKSSSSAVVPIELGFTYTAGNPPFFSFRGNLWPPLTDTDKSKSIVARINLNPNAPLVPLLVPKQDANQSIQYQYYMSLLDLPGQNADQMSSFQTFLASTVPTRIINLAFEINTDQISFYGNMIVDPDVVVDPTKKPWLVLETISINAVYTWSTKSLAFTFQAELLLQPRTPPPTYVSVIDLEIDYVSTNKSWTVIGTLDSLCVGSLYSLFPSADNDSVMDLMEDILINNFTIVYHHENNFTSFASSAQILLSEVELDLTFNYDTNGWRFDALLSNYNSTGVNLGDFLSGISSELGSILPDFLAQSNFAIPAGSSIELKCERLNEDYLLFALVAKTVDFEFAFCQLSTTGQDPNDESETIRVKKRLFKFTLDTLPGVDSVPLLASLTQPFDQLDFLWLDESLTRSEVELLNSEVFKSPTDEIVYKDPRTATNDPQIVDATGNQSLDKVLLAGCHFIIIAEQNNEPTAILDYNFAGTPVAPPTDSDDEEAPVSSSPPVNGAVPAFGGFGGPVLNNNTGPSSTGPTSTAPFSKTLGPLTISAIGLKYEGGKLSLTLDAKITLGAVIGTLKGFGIRFPMQDIYTFSISDVEVLVEGVGLEMNRPPVVLAGMLVHDLTSYSGGVIIEVEPYTFLAAGYYGVILNSKGENIKSVFVYAELDGPIAEVEFASLSGLTGGFGYNSDLRFPTVDNVTTFPFLADTAVGSDPLTVLTSLTSQQPPWFSPKEGPIWIAGGLTVAAFQVINIKAVIVVDLTEDVVFAIFGDCTAAIPESASSNAERFALIDMGVLAVLDYAKGIFHTEGQLTPKSFILSQDCHLSGGFALAYWFAGSGHEGDWVFSVGGYHSAFAIPDWYPRPKRLAISWKYDTEISIYGEAYFAVTPKVCMGGGALKLAYESGKLSAHFDAYADFLINYRPFSFIADIKVSVGAKYTATVFCVTKTFSADFSAAVHLQGPPLAGYAKIDWSIISFTIHFGSADPPTEAIPWADFVSLIRQDDPNNPPSIESNTGNGMHSYSATSGLLTNQGTNAAVKSAGSTPWSVNGILFAFSFNSIFPITQFGYKSSGSSYSGGPRVYMKPMHINDDGPAVISTVEIQITPKNNPSVPSPICNLARVIQKVPAALWGPYNSAQDPSKGSSSSELLKPDNSTIDLAMGIAVSPPPPTESTDILELSILSASTYTIAGSTIPSSNFIPTTYKDTAGATQPLTDSTGVAIQISFNTATALSLPVTSSIPYSAYNTLGRLRYPKQPAADILDSWMTFSGVTADAPLGQRIQGLKANTSADRWIGEMSNDLLRTAPLPVLSAGATLDALAPSGLPAGFGLQHFPGAGPMLNREFEVGSLKVA